jgi:hypothetical protein
MVMGVLAVRVDGVVGVELNLAETTKEFVVHGHDVLTEQKRHVDGCFSGILMVGGGGRKEDEVEVAREIERQSANWSYRLPRKKSYGFYIR